MESFVTSLVVRFADIDHAGIVYYPRFLHYCHVAYEEFLEKRLGIPLKELLDERRVGFPTVKAEVDFVRPLRLGDRVSIAIDVTRLGESSVVMRYRLRREGDDRPAAEARVTTASIDMESFRPIPVPADIRAVLESYQAS